MAGTDLNFNDDLKDYVSINPKYKTRFSLAKKNRDSKVKTFV